MQFNIKKLLSTTLSHTTTTTRLAWKFLVKYTVEYDDNMRTKFIGEWVLL